MKKRRKYRKKFPSYGQTMPLTCEQEAYWYLEVTLDQVKSMSFQLSHHHEDIADLLIGVIGEMEDTLEILNAE